jgi:hypothetical protein
MKKGSLVVFLLFIYTLCSLHCQNQVVKWENEQLCKENSAKLKYPDCYVTIGIGKGETIEDAKSVSEIDGIRKMPAQITLTQFNRTGIIDSDINVSTKAISSMQIFDANYEPIDTTRIDGYYYFSSIVRTRKEQNRTKLGETNLNNLIGKKAKYLNCFVAIGIGKGKTIYDAKRNSEIDGLRQLATQIARQILNCTEISNSEVSVITKAISVIQIRNPEYVPLDTAFNNGLYNFSTIVSKRKDQYIIDINEPDLQFILYTNKIDAIIDKIIKLNCL